MAALSDNIVVGTCTAMCPYDELKLREREHLLHSFEILDGTKRNKHPTADHSKTVKEYTRPAAGKDELKPYQLRPASTLIKTVDHLIDNVLTKTDVGWDHVYHFVFNRLRAVRQDLVIQQIIGEDAIGMFEKIVSFHILADYKLCIEEASVFDPKINETHARECLKRLLILYQATDGMHKRREEFECLYVLYNLGNTEALLHALSLPQHLRHSKSLQLCFQIARSHCERNYVRFLRLVQRLSPLACCAVSRHLVSVASQTLCIMSHGFSSKNLKYPLEKLQQLLNYDSLEQVKVLCHSYGVSTVDGSAVFLKSNFNTEGKVKPLHLSWIDEKLIKQTIPCLLKGES